MGVLVVEENTAREQIEAAKSASGASSILQHPVVDNCRRRVLEDKDVNMHLREAIRKWRARKSR